MSQVSIDPTLFDSLPVLPQTLVQLIEACNDEQRNLSEIGQIVASDPTIAGRVLQLANSAFLGARSKFSSIEQAAIFLGVETVRNLAISVSVHEAFAHSTATTSFRLEHFWYHSLLTALLAKHLATRINHPKPAAAYLCGLLHDLGKLVLLDWDSDRYQRLLTEAKQGQSLTTLEQEAFGINHAGVSARLLCHWQLEEMVIDPVENHHNRWNGNGDDRDLGLITSLANDLAHPAPDWEGLESQLCDCGLERSQVQDLLAGLHQEVDELATAFGIHAKQEPVGESEPAINRLQAALFDLSRLAAVHDSLMLAVGVEEICRAMEETALIHFAVEQTVMLLPEADRWHALASASNPLREKMQWLVSQKIRKDDLRQLIEGPVLQTLNQGKVTTPRDDELLQIFSSRTLYSLSFAWTANQRGLLLFTTVSSSPSDELVKALRLLLGAGANRLRLEIIQERRAHELAAIKAETLQQAARSIAHEIATPLNTLTNFLELISRRDHLDPKLTADLALIRGELERLVVVSRGFNHLSEQPETRSIQSVDLGHEIRQIVRLYQRHPLIDKKISLRSRIDDDLPPISTDPVSLRQIIVNLLQNSIEAIDSEQGQISLQVYKSTCVMTRKTTVTISITDNGKGLDADFSATLLQPGNSGKGQEHAGLGLSIVKKLSHNIGATLTWGSNRDGHTVFTLVLPTEHS